MTPEQRDKHLKRIEKIESMTRPEKWREIKKFVLEVNPKLAAVDADFAQACKELRQRHSSKTGSSKSGDLRNTMKLPQYIYEAITNFDPDVKIEMSGRNHGHQKLISEQLWKAFPEYRIARSF